MGATNKSYWNICLNYVKLVFEKFLGRNEVTPYVLETGFASLRKPLAIFPDSFQALEAIQNHAQYSFKIKVV